LKIPLCTFQSVRQASGEVSKQPDASHYACRPFNQFDSDFTEWWLVPSAEWPACHHGKLFLWRTPEYSCMSNRLYAGYYIEHGFDGAAAEFAKDKKQVMQKNWYWHEFVRIARKGDFDEIAPKVAALSDSFLWCLIKVTEVNHAPRFDEERGLPKDKMEFAIDGAGRFTIKQPARNVLTSFNESESIADLSEIFFNSKDLDYYWIDFLMGVLLGYGSQQKSAWGAEEVWNRALEPWISYVR
jgi:hypothetical protein